MYTASLILAALTGSTLVSAAPHGSHQGSKSITSSASFPTAVKLDGNKFEYPLSNGFPSTISDSNLLAIEKAAGGLEVNAVAAPLSSTTGFASTTLTVLRLIAFNELMEVAFFTELLTNITNNVPGYDILFGFDREYILASLTAIQAQEQLHALNANGGLAVFDKTIGAIQPCEYTFPVSNFQDAINLANAFTDVVLGTLQDGATAVGADGDVGLVRDIAAVIGQEGQQDGFFRFLQNRLPSAQPFITASAGPFAFSALNQNFVVPGSCPQDIDSFGLPPVFGSLSVLGGPLHSGDQTLTFKAVQASSYPVGNFSDLQLVYINGQNLPIAENITNIVSCGNGIWEFDAFFPQQTDILHGLTIAALIPSNTTFTITSNVDDVAKVAVFGPGLIEILA